MSAIRSHRPRRAFAPALLPLAAATILALAGGPSHAQQLLAPTATVASFSQSFLLAQLTQWEISFPSATNPLLDTTGAQAASGDQGSYFFLASSFSPDPVVRSVTVRTDQVLVFNPTGAFFWVTPADVIRTESAMRAELVDIVGDLTRMEITVDGAPVALPNGFTSLDQFLQSTPLFPLSIPAGSLLNEFGYPSGSFPAVALGYTYALEGLTNGQHQLRFASTIMPTGNYAGSGPISFDVTYNINAVPEASTWAMLLAGLGAVAALARRRRPV